jgi:hypothetical protein
VFALLVSRCWNRLVGAVVKRCVNDQGLFYTCKNIQHLTNLPQTSASAVPTTFHQVALLYSHYLFPDVVGAVVKSISTVLAL